MSYPEESCCKCPIGYTGLVAVLLNKRSCGMFHNDDREPLFLGLRPHLVLEPPSVRALRWLCPVASWHQCFGECGSLVCCCVFDFTSEGADGFLWSLNKDDCSSERALLSNKYRISWTMANPEQVFYSLAGTCFPHFLEMPWG